MIGDGWFHIGLHWLSIAGTLQPWALFPDAKW